MLIEVVVGMFLAVERAIVSHTLPIDGAPSALGDVVGGIVPYYAWLNTWAPVDEAFQLAAVSLAVTAIMAVIYVATWVLTKLHVLGGV